MNIKEKPNIAAIDLFCGIGGLTCGLKKAGINVIAGVDIDEKCKYAYEENNGAIFLHKSINDINKDEIKKLYPIDCIKILAGCAPCQPFSTHTQKIKDRKERDDWGLLAGFLETVKKVDPLVVTMENVPQLMKHEIFDDFVKGLKMLGYETIWQNVYCPNYGIPQRRRRLVLFASKLGKVELIKPTHKPANYKTVKVAIGNLDPLKAGATSNKDRLHKAAGLSEINLKRMKQSKPGGTWQDWGKTLRAKCHKKKTGGTYRSVYARMEWDKPSPTITTQFFNFGTGRFGHPKQDRAISIREGALLQTFPKKYKFIPSSSPVVINELGRYIGNAVPVRLGEIIGRSIIKHLEAHL